MKEEIIKQIFQITTAFSCAGFWYLGSNSFPESAVIGVLTYWIVDIYFNT